MMKDFTPEQLDELKVIENDQVLCCIGLLVTLYFREGQQPEKREALWRCHERYWEVAGSHLRWGSHPGTGRPVNLSKQKLPSLREWIDQLGEEDELELTYHGGQHKNDADAHSLAIYTSRLNEYKLGFLSATLPFSWVAQNPAGSFVRLVQEFSEYLHPYHGYGGLAVIPHVAHSKARESRSELSVYAIARRFPGLEVDYPVSHLRHLGTGIKGVNWLTVLSDSWLEASGGKASLRTQLDESFVFHDFSGGTIIQAGPHPQLGDINRRDIPEHYRVLSRLLKPIRAAYPDVLQADAEGFDDARTQQWLSRFD